MVVVVQTVWKVGRDAIEAGTDLVPVSAIDLSLIFLFRNGSYVLSTIAL